MTLVAAGQSGGRQFWATLGLRTGVGSHFCVLSRSLYLPGGSDAAEAGDSTLSRTIGAAHAAAPAMPAFLMRDRRSIPPLSSPPSPSAVSTGSSLCPLIGLL